MFREIFNMKLGRNSLSNICIVKGCHSQHPRQSSDIHMFRFPRDQERCRLWAKACNAMEIYQYYTLLKSTMYSSYYRVCNHHFEDCMYAGNLKKRLHCDAVPTLFLAKPEKSPTSLENVDSKSHISLEQSSEREYTESLSGIQEIDSNAEKNILESNSILRNLLKANKTTVDSLQMTRDPLDLQNYNPEDIIIIDDDEIKYADILTIKHDHNYYSPFESVSTNVVQNQEVYVNSEKIIIEHQAPDKPNIENQTENRGKSFLNIDLAQFGNVNLQNISGVILLLNNNQNVTATNIVSNNASITTTDTNLKEVIPEINAEKPKHISQKQKINKEPEIHKCEYCSKPFQSPKRLQNHKRKDHYYHCEFCEDSCFETIVEIKSHVKKHHPQVDYRTCKPYFCDICNQEFSERIRFMKHFRSAHDGHICGVCGWSFLSKDELNLHRDTHPNKYECDVCDKSFKEKSALTTHKEIHNDPFSFICPKCGKGCKTKTALSGHVKTHDPPKKVMCDMCSKFFRNTTKLVMHQQAVHFKMKKFQCPECDKKFATKSLLQSHHYVMHVGEKPFQCEFCGKEFARRDYLYNHRHVHTGEPRKPRKNVNMIPKRLRQKREYNFAFRLGKYKNQPMTCNICGKTIKNINYLRIHLNTHARIRKFECSFCGLKFMHQTSRNNHEKTHALDPENQVVCPVCWKKMKTQEELDIHLEQHNNRPKRHTCAECGKVFSRKHLLENHITIVHTTEEELNKIEQEMIEKSFKEIVQQHEFVI